MKDYLHLGQGMDATAKKELERRYEEAGKVSRDKCGLPMN
jgi:hypothetical protein